MPATPRRPQTESPPPRARCPRRAPASTLPFLIHRRSLPILKSASRPKEDIMSRWSRCSHRCRGSVPRFALLTRENVVAPRHLLLLTRENVVAPRHLLLLTRENPVDARQVLRSRPRERVSLAIEVV